MACYWGYDTKSNRLVYTWVIGCLTIGCVIIAAGLIGGYTNDNCLRRYRSCTRNLDAPTCTNQLEDCKIRTWQNLLTAGATICVAGLAGTIYFCFCSRAPPDPYASSYQGVALQAVPLPPPPAYPTSPVQPVMGVPVSGQPYPYYAPPPGAQPWNAAGPAYHVPPPITTATISSPNIALQSVQSPTGPTPASSSAAPTKA